MLEDIEIVGEAEAGRAIQVRRQINKLLAATNTSTYDLADLLWEAKSKNFFSGWGFESFAKYAKSLDIKYSRAFYLVRMVENMKAAGLERAQYEPVGLLKLRIISRLKPETEYNGTPVTLLIRELTLKAQQMTAEEVRHEVDTIQGLTEDESMVWINFQVKKLVRENVIKAAIALAKKHMPESQTQDNDGNYHPPSDGAALEVICANFLADPNFQEDVPQETVSDDTSELTEEEGTESMDTNNLPAASFPEGVTFPVDTNDIPVAPFPEGVTFQDILLPTDETIAKILK